MEKKKSNIPNPPKGMQILPRMLIDDYEKVWDKDINEFLNGTKVHVTVILTKEIVDAYNETPELKYKLSQRLRFLISQDLINNGFGGDHAEEKLKLIHHLKRDLEASEAIILDKIQKRTEKRLIESHEKAERIRLQDKFAKFLLDESINYGEMLKIRLQTEKPKEAKAQILELIKTRLKPEVKEHFKKELSPKTLYKSMGLDEIA